MNETLTRELTRMLKAWGAGDQQALEKLAQNVYPELHKLAHRQMAQEREGHMLQTTALINEAFIRLIDWKEVRWQNRAHFFAASAQMMRRILVDAARSRDYAKRGGGAALVSFDEECIPSPARDQEVLDVDDALNRLAEFDERKSKVVELKFFGGLGFDEIAEVLKISRRTAINDWNLAKAWLHREIKGASKT